MTATLFRLAPATERSASALVVQPNLSELLFVLSTLTSIGFDVIVAQTFQDAKRSLSHVRPSLLVTDVRLLEYNGLHLILRLRSLWNDVPAVLTSTMNDTVLQDEAERLGATFVVLPVTPGELMAAVCRTALRDKHSNQTAIRPPFERRGFDRRRVVSSSVATERRQKDRRREVSQLLRLIGSPS